jgi:hypothetical protein
VPGEIDIGDPMDPVWANFRIFAAKSGSSGRKTSWTPKARTMAC